MKHWKNTEVLDTPDDMRRKFCGSSKDTCKKIFEPSPSKNSEKKNYTEIDKEKIYYWDARTQ